VLIHPVDTMSDVEPDDDLIVHHHHRRRRRGPGGRTGILIVVVLVALAGGGLWWHGAVTADPGLSFDGGGNVFRTAEAGDVTGITRVENSLGADVNVAYQAGAPLHAFFGLYNDGPRTVTVEALPRQGFYYWAFDGAAVSTNPQTAFVGRDYTPFRPFRLRRGETRYVRLDFHTAICDPAGLQSGSSRIVSLPVRYRTLGVTRTATVPFERLSIGVLTIGRCDHPLELSRP
jgi:hypothetical protein